MRALRSEEEVQNYFQIIQIFPTSVSYGLPMLGILAIEHEEQSTVV
jgi:hypothetical protein